MSRTITAPDAPTHVAVIFDKGSHTFRNDLYDAYKANREEMPEDLRPQIPLTREATRAFNIACEEIEGFEADDIIATLAWQAREAGGRVTIISSDKDLMQLVGDGVEMLDAMKNRRIDAEGVREKFGVGPDRVVDVQALAGDSVDNMPGAPGIGVKTAALLINEYGDLETLLAQAEQIKQPKRRQTLIEKREQIELSKRLVQLDATRRSTSPSTIWKSASPTRTGCWPSSPRWSSARSAGALPRRSGSSRRRSPSPPTPRGGRGRPGLARHRPRRLRARLATWTRSTPGSRRSTARDMSPSTPRPPRSTRCAPIWSASASRWSPARPVTSRWRHRDGSGDLFGADALVAGPARPRGGAGAPQAAAGGRRDPEDRAEHEIRRQDPGRATALPSPPSTTPC